MDGESGDAAPGLTAGPPAIAADAGFFQVVRSILRRKRQDGGTAAGGALLGGDERLAREPVRFRAATGMRFAATEIVEADAAKGDGKPELVVGFMGLTGPSGVLPDHYSGLMVERRRARDQSLADFLDIFNHRAVSLFYRAWAKYRLPVRYEESGRRVRDPFSRAMAALMGLGLESQRARLDGEESDLLTMAGPMARQVRTAGALQRLVAGLFGFGVELCEFEGRWLPIAPEEQTRLSAADLPLGAFSALSETTVVGAAVWDVQSRIRLRLGPLGLRDFRRFFEPGGLGQQVVRTVRTAIGPSIEFDLQLILDRNEIPPLRLDDPLTPAFLGQTTWLSTTTPDRDRDDAILSSAQPPSKHAERAPGLAVLGGDVREPAEVEP